MREVEKKFLAIFGLVMGAILSIAGIVYSRKETVMLVS